MGTARSVPATAIRTFNDSHTTFHVRPCRLWDSNDGFTVQNGHKKMKVDMDAMFGSNLNNGAMNVELRNLNDNSLLAKASVVSTHKVTEQDLPKPAKGELPLWAGGRWKSSPFSPEDCLRYSWSFACEATLQDSEGNQFAKLTVLGSGITRVALKHPEMTHRYHPAMDKVAIHLVLKGGKVVSVDTGVDGWNDGFVLSEVTKDMMLVGNPKVDKKFRCELFDCFIDKDYHARINTKSGYPDAEALLIAFLLCFPLHPAVTMQALHRGDGDHDEHPAEEEKRLVKKRFDEEHRKVLGEFPYA
mmetsp:Transcript_84264/g.161056  ORF Transcript_84264/g.161056 Transcript_84264/m.161056 type:complete len:301 (-) Transcript_84264:13-915(-)